MTEYTKRLWVRLMALGIAKLADAANIRLHWTGWQRAVLTMGSMQTFLY